MGFVANVNGIGSFGATVDQQSALLASMAVMGPKGDKGDTGNTGPAGVVAATAPILYNAGTQTVSIDPAYKPNPFDQSLNSTDSPTFENIALSGPYGISLSGSYSTGIDSANLYFASLTVTEAAGLSMPTAGQKIVFPDATEQTTAYTGGDLKAVNNLSDLTNAPLARSNLGLGSIATASASDYYLSTNPSGFITSAALAPYLTSSTAASTYQTISGMSAYLTTSAASSTYQPLSGMSAYLTTSAAASTYYLQTNPSGFITSAALTGYATESWVTGQGYITSAALSPYLTSATAASTYQTISGMSSYLTTASAASTYQTISGMSAYLTTSSAASTYQTISGMSAYLTTSSAASTYQTISGMSAYLTTASAASTYLTQSNAASTYQTQAGMSSYATLASPVFTGDPRGPTPATSDNDTSLATTAFVNAYCPPASTTSAGKVQLATDAQAIAASSSTLGITARTAKFASMEDIWSPSAVDMTAGTSGAGAAAGSTNALRWINTAPNASTAGFANRGFLLHYTSKSAATSTTYDGVQGVGCIFYPGSNYTAGSNVIFRAIMGRRGSAIPSPTYAVAEKSFGFEVEFNTTTPVLRVFGHNGTTLSTSSATFSLTNQRPVSAVAIKDGTTVRLYIDGTEVASTSGGPSGNETGISWAQYELVQEATAATGNIAVTVTNPKVIMPVV